MRSKKLNILALRELVELATEPRKCVVYCARIDAVALRSGAGKSRCIDGLALPISGIHHQVTRGWEAGKRRLDTTEAACFLPHRHGDS